MNSERGDLKEAGFPHSEICGSAPICRLPAAFRRLSRPSSPIIAKASTTCTCSLDPITSRSQGILTLVIHAIHSPVSLLLVASSQRGFRKDNYLLSQIVKEQPIGA